MLIDIKPSDIETARHSNFLDELELLHSPKGGHIVATAVKSGVFVCWQCGEPFVQDDRQLDGVEKLVPGATVPLYVHRKCFNGPNRRIFSVVMKGLRTRKAVADIVKKTEHLLGLQPEPKIVVPDPIPARPADPDWRFKRRAEVAHVTVEALEPLPVAEGMTHTPRFRATISDLELSAESNTEDDARIKVRELAVEVYREKERAQIAAIAAEEAKPA